MSIVSRSIHRVSQNTAFKNGNKADVFMKNQAAIHKKYEENRAKGSREN